MTRYRAKTGARIPMPDRPGQHVPDSGEGISVDELSPYYLRLIAAGDLVPVTDEPPAAPAGKTGKTAAASREGTP